MINFKVGDVVAVIGGFDSGSVSKSRVRKLYKNGNLVIDGDLVQFKQDGFSAGVSFYSYRLEHWTDDHAQRLATREATCAFGKIKPGSLSLDQLQRIVAIAEEGE